MLWDKKEIKNVRERLPLTMATSPRTNSFSSGHFLGRTPLFRLAGHVRHGCFAWGEEKIGSGVIRTTNPPGPQPIRSLSDCPRWDNRRPAESTEFRPSHDRAPSSADDGARDAIG